jgi:hypothetical protein
MKGDRASLLILSERVMVLWHQIKRVFDALKFLTFATNRGVTAALTKMTALAETLTGKRFKLFTKTIQNLCQ